MCIILRYNTKREKIFFKGILFWFKVKIIAFFYALHAPLNRDLKGETLSKPQLRISTTLPAYPSPEGPYCSRPFLFSPNLFPTTYYGILK